MNGAGKVTVGSGYSRDQRAYGGKAAAEVKAYSLPIRPPGSLKSRMPNSPPGFNAR